MHDSNSTTKKNFEISTFSYYEWRRWEYKKNRGEIRKKQKKSHTDTE